MCPALSSLDNNSDFKMERIAVVAIIVFLNIQLSYLQNCSECTWVGWGKWQLNATMHFYKRERLICCPYSLTGKPLNETTLSDCVYACRVHFNVSVDTTNSTEIRPVTTFTGRIIIFCFLFSTYDLSCSCHLVCMRTYEGVFKNTAERLYVISFSTL